MKDSEFPMNIPVHVIIVTHNSATLLPVCLAHLNAQRQPISTVIIVDSGSEDSRYLDNLDCRWPIVVVKNRNIGFGRANNIGFQQIQGDDGVVVFLNPDTFLPVDFLAGAVNRLEANPLAGAISGKLLGFDLKQMKATGKIDSTGIYRRWYGRWYDRGQGQDDTGQYEKEESVPALCGALMVCRLLALKEDCGQPFDPDFFLYKEDIELSIRLRKRGWELIYSAALPAFHCRGWNQNRQSIPYELRIIAAKNEVLLYKKHPSIYVLWALMKMLLVKVFRL